MAVMHHSPLPASIADPVSFKEASALLRRTGHPASVSTLQRWMQEENIFIERVGRTDYVSYSSILEIHAERVRARDN